MNKTLSVILLSSMLFLQWPTAIAQKPNITIAGTVLPSGGNEGDTHGDFTISGHVDANGEFSGKAHLYATGPGIGPNNEITIDRPVQGNYAMEGDVARLYFSGQTNDGALFRGQLRSDSQTVAFFVEGKFTGFSDVPANGYMTLIAVQGVGDISPP